MIATDQGRSQVTGDCAVPFQDSGTEWGRGREEAGRYYKRHFDPQHQSDVSGTRRRTFASGLSVSQHLSSILSTSYCLYTRIFLLYTNLIVTELLIHHTNY